LGVDAKGTDDGAIIQGLGSQGAIGGGEVISHGDHRIAMSFTIASLRASETIKVLDCANVATSFPGFIELAQNCGINVQLGG